MALAVPIVALALGVGQTAYSIVNSENAKADAKTSSEQQIKANNLKALKDELTQLDIEQETAQLTYNKAVDEANRKAKITNIIFVSATAVLFLVGIIFTIKINSSEKRNVLKSQI